MHPFILHNREIVRSDEPMLLPGQVGFLNGWGVFSTLLVHDGQLFAFERHYARMRRDAALLHVPFDFSPETLEELLLLLVSANRVEHAVLRTAIVRNRGGLFEAPRLQRDADLIAFTAPVTDWPSGVHLTYMADARHAASPFAGVKTTSWAYNLVWNERVHEAGFDEAILLNERGEISECTSANIFAIHGDQVLTPPLASSGCLPGITRALLLEDIHIKGLTVREAVLTPSSLEASDCVFITSSTRNLLPVLTVDRYNLRQSPGKFERLVRAFGSYRDTYFERRQSAASTLTHAKS